MCVNSCSECVGCNSGYFLKDSKCIEFPVTSIQFKAGFFPEKTFLNENYSSDLDTKCNLEDVYYNSGIVVDDFTAYCISSW